ncbi:MAG TPA: dihydrolipoamide acetyltransferase family protein [Mycobacteriales bacterium]|nr:dihydrolipoamide acetyltransferase family protein [Mycobacteriales bacterium]
MPTFRDFALPDLGEGLTEGEILAWHVAVGDEVKLNQPIVEVETAKAAVEIPSPHAGVVSALHCGVGDTVDVGTAIITFDIDPGGSVAPQPELTVDQASIQGGDMVPSEPGIIGSPAPKGGEEKVQILVGSGLKASKLTRRPRVAAGRPAERSNGDGSGPPVQPARVSAAAVGARAERLAEVHVLAKPPVRKLARDLGVDLRVIGGTGPDGTVTRDDVQAAASGQPAGMIAAVSPAPDFDPATREQRIPVKGVRKMTAEAMVASAFTAPHVTEWVSVDMTPAMDLVGRLREHEDFAETKVSPLLLVARAMILAIRRHPMINSSWDDAAQEIVVKDYVNLGIAAATPRGLIVPNIKDAGRLSMPELAQALERLVEVARGGHTPPADMARGTITITNVGVFGVDGGTPILNPGESAILCFGAVRDMPWVHEGRIEIRKVTQLGLSFDHRIVDGQLGSEFLADLAGMLADPWRLVTWH